MAKEQKKTSHSMDIKTKSSVLYRVVVRDHTRKLLSKEDFTKEAKAWERHDELLGELKYRILEFQKFDESDRCSTVRQTRL